MDKKQKIGLKGRAVWSLFMFFSFLMLIPSGILLHVFSPDEFDTRVHVLMTIHNVCAINLRHIGGCPPCLQPKIGAVVF